MIRALLFDVDGVLVEPWRFRTYLEEDYGIGPHMTAGFFRGPFVDCSLGKADLRKQLPSYLDTWEWPRTVEEFLTLWFRADGVVNEPVLRAVRRLRQQGYAVYVASTQEAVRARYLANELRLESEFDGLFFSCDLGAMKPEAKFFRLVSEALGMRADELLFFDDVQANVDAARLAGWRAERFLDYPGFERQIVHHLVEPSHSR